MQTAKSAALLTPGINCNMSFLLHPRTAALFHPFNSFFYPGAACASGACGPRAYYAPRHSAFDSFFNDPLDEFFNDDYLFPRVKFARFVPNRYDDDDAAAMDISDESTIREAKSSASVPLRESKGTKKDLLKSSDSTATMREVDDNQSDNRLSTLNSFGDLLQARNSFFRDPGLKFDVNETEDALSISSQLQGFDKNDLKVDYDRGNLVISGEKKIEHKDERTGAISRSYKSFTRSFTLPDNIDKDGIRAKYKDEDSRLTIEVPKIKPAEQSNKETTIEIN